MDKIKKIYSAGYYGIGTVYQLHIKDPFWTTMFKYLNDIIMCE